MELLGESKRSAKKAGLFSTEVKILRENGYIIEEKIHLGSKGGYGKRKRKSRNLLRGVVRNESILFGKFKPKLFSWIVEKTMWETITF